jgi:hypothetical protein
MIFAIGDASFAEEDAQAKDAATIVNFIVS